MAKNNSDKSNSFSGWQGRSGLDPIDTYRIEANVDGVFLRRLFTLKLRTRNFFALIGLLFLGTGVTGLMIFAIYAMTTTQLYVRSDVERYVAIGGFYCLTGFFLLIGVALLLNFLINLGIVLGYVRTQSGSRNKDNRKEAKKKLPKRRKDYQ